MSKQVFSVFLPDRRSPIRVEAEKFRYFGLELALENGDEVVARSSDRGFVVRDDAVIDFDSGLEAASIAVSDIKSHPAPVWPFLAGAGAALAGLYGVANWLV